MKAALQLHPSKVTRRYLEELVYPALLANGVKHYLLPKRHDGDVELEKGTDFLIVIGGDGTFLSGAKVAVQYGVPVVGVMTGRLGFLCNVSIEEFPDVVKRIAEGKVPVSKRPKSEELKTPWADGCTFPGTGKNAPCPCGSGRKYKMCHGQNEK